MRTYFLDHSKRRKGTKQARRSSTQRVSAMTTLKLPQLGWAAEFAHSYVNNAKSFAAELRKDPSSLKQRIPTSSLQALVSCVSKL